MERVLLTDIPLELDATGLLEKYRLEPGSERAEGIRRLVEAASARARPKALYVPCAIDGRGEEHVTAAGVTFRSRVLAVNLEKVHRVFPFVATCGMELETWSRSLAGGLDKFCAEEIKGTALGAAVLAVVAHIQEHHCPGPVSMMNPGSLEDWPVSEQKPLFDVLGGDARSVVGVTLLDSLLMEPGMTASGIWFPAEERFENCMLCPREACPGRRAPHDPELVERRYRKKPGAG